VCVVLSNGAANSRSGRLVRRVQRCHPPATPRDASCVAPTHPAAACPRAQSLAVCLVAACRARAPAAPRTRPRAPWPWWSEPAGGVGWGQGAGGGAKGLHANGATSTLSASADTRATRLHARARVGCITPDPRHPRPRAANIHTIIHSSEVTLGWRAIHSLSRRSSVRASAAADACAARRAARACGGGVCVRVSDTTQQVWTS
jgi:hypothetical protein